MHDISIKRIMTTRPAAIGPDTSISAVRTLLESGEIHHLPVVEAGKLVGIVSSSDLLKLYLLEGGAEGASGDGPSVRQIMQLAPVALTSTASLRDAATRLCLGGYHALPVVEADRRLVGIVTTGDLITYLLQQIPRGDGSLRPRHAAESEDHPDERAVHDVLLEAERLVENGEDTGAEWRVLLHLRDRNRRLQDACHAAEVFIRSGHGAREHSTLVKCLEDLQQSPARAGL